VRAPRGAKLNTKRWQTEVAVRMLMSEVDAADGQSRKELLV
jgi:urocanate hydratase